MGQLASAPSNEALIGRIFEGTKYKVAYEPNMGDYLLCHAAFVLPAAFACYKTDGDLKKLKGNTAYLSRMIDANIEGYRAIRSATSLGKICVSDHAMNAVDEMSALDRDLKRFFEEAGADNPVWQALEREAGKYLQ